MHTIHNNIMHTVLLASSRVATVVLATCRLSVHTLQ
jgi:hypothetical protein